MEIFLGIMVFVLGLCLGSFVNMLVYRVAIKYKIKKNPITKKQETNKFQISNFNKKRSFCDFCGRQLRWYENIPVLSWFLQSGKTRCCKKKLPLAYPITELIMGILFLVYFKLITNNQIYNFQTITNFSTNNYQTFLIFILGFVIITFLVFSAGFDLKYMILPDFSTGILAVCGIIMIIIEGKHIGLPVQNIGIGLLVSAFFLFLYWITKGKGMGMGDVKLVFFMGLFLGWQRTIVALYTAFIIGAIVGIFLMAFKKIKRKTEIPFGPFLILGTFVGWWWGMGIWYYVLSIMY